jgi:hypothetical protein
MPKFLVLIYGDEQKWEEASEQWQQQNGADHRAFAELAGAAVIGGHELETTRKAVSLRSDSKRRRTTTDGPFLETKEVLGGFYLLEAPDLDEAVRLAWHIPEASAPFSGVEVRPIAQ